MHRSASTTRVSDDYFNYISTSASAASPSPGTSSKVSPLVRALSVEAEEQLPVYEPVSEVAKKEKPRAKFAENAVHVIPFVLLLCAFILWFFSNPDIDVPMKADSIAARIEGLTIEGDIDNDSDGTQTGTLPLELGDLDSAKQDEYPKTSSKLGNKS